MVRLEVVAPKEVFVCVGGGQNNDWNVLQSFVGLHFREDLPPAFSGQFEIKHDQVRPGRLRVLAFLAQERHRLFAVLRHVEAMVEAGHFHGLYRDIDIRGIVLNQQNFVRADLFIIAHGLLSSASCKVK